MTPAIAVVWTDRHRPHEPRGEVWVGVRTPGTEVPGGAEAIREALSDTRGTCRSGRCCPPSPALGALEGGQLMLSEALIHAFQRDVADGLGR